MKKIRKVSLVGFYNDARKLKFPTPVGETLDLIENFIGGEGRVDK